MAGTPADPAAVQRKVPGQRGLLWRQAALVVPRREGLPVTADVLFRAAEGNQDEPPGPAVDEPPAHGERDADQLAALERLRLALDQEGEGSVEHQVDLLLLRVAVDASRLARPQHDLVEAEGRDPELPPQGEEARRRHSRHYETFPLDVERSDEPSPSSRSERSREGPPPGRTARAPAKCRRVRSQSPPPRDSLSQRVIDIRARRSPRNSRAG